MRRLDVDRLVEEITGMKMNDLLSSFKPSKLEKEAIDTLVGLGKKSTHKFKEIYYTLIHA